MANYLIKTLADGRVMFTLEEEGEIIMTSEPYLTVSECLAGIDRMKAICRDYRGYTRNLSRDLQFYFVLKALNGDMIATSGSFETAVVTEIAIDWVRKYGQTANLQEQAVGT